MANGPPRDRSGDIDDFRAAAERQVWNLRDAIGDLPPSLLLEETLDHEEGVLEEVAPQREAVTRLKARVRWERYRRAAQVLNLIVFAVLLSLIPLELIFGIPGWPRNWATIAFGASIVFVLLSSTIARRWASTDSSSSSSPAQSMIPLGDRLRSAESAYRAALDATLQRWLTERANVNLGEIYAESLPDLDPTGLAEIDDPEHEVATKDADNLESAIEHMPGGSIGVSGPRGVGKSTLLRRLTIEAQRQQPAEIETAIVVDAPVEYDARDFVLHLFARLCEGVLGPERVDEMRGWGRGLGPSRRPLSPLLRVLLGPPPLGPALLVVGLIAYIAMVDGKNELRPTDLELWSLLAITFGGALTILNLIPSVLLRAEEAFSALLAVTRPPGADSRSLSRRAERHLRQIWFQRTFSSGWSGALKLPIGVEAGTERSTQLAENQLSFPDVVALYKEFVKRLAEDGQVRIGIDELDKMDDERARRFLNEIKVIFRVSGCFYLVSVSEDAMAYFERRGLPFRDVFDSSFDDVMRMGYLPYVGSRRLIRRRVVGMPIQFISLCHVLGGGLARDVIRASREVCETKSGKTIAEVAEKLCSEQLRSKCIATGVAVRRLGDPAHVILLSRWLREIDEAAPNPRDLLTRCTGFEAEILTELGTPPSDDREGLKEYREALSIAFEVISFAYFVATVQDLMATLKTPETTRTAIHTGTVDLLAKARQAFAVNPGEAWEAISAVRSFPIGADPIELPRLQVSATASAPDPVS